MMTIECNCYISWRNKNKSKSK